MKAEIKDIEGTKYIDFLLEPVFQKNKVFYLAKVDSYSLIKLFTVRPAKYDIEKNSSLAKSFPDERDYYDHLLNKNRDLISDKDFQRKFDNNRVNGIKNYLEDEDHAFFPNTIIANCELINDYDSYGLNEAEGIESFLELNEKPDHLSYLYKDDSTFHLLVPFRKNSILIIDGQHRLEGLKLTNEEFQKNFEVIIAFIIGYDRSTIAKQFYTINYEQKPVNKSLLYHLTGEFSTDLDEITFMHNAVKILNELDYSPFHNRIKMLGVNPPNATKEEKKLLSISQAFLIDSLIRSISASAKNSLYQPIFLHYYLNKDLQIEIIRFLIKYFRAISELKDEWNNPDTSLISKGMGVGALIKVLHFLFPMILIDEWNFDPLKIEEIKIDHIKGFLDGIENVDFSKEGKYGGVGSAGSINKIKEDLIEQINYFKTDHYSTFEEFFKEEYLPKFKDWNISNNIE